MSKRLNGLSPCVEPRISFRIRLPELRAKAWRRIRVGAERRSLRAQKSAAYHRRRKSLRRCAIREVNERRPSKERGGSWKRRGEAHISPNEGELAVWRIAGARLRNIDLSYHVHEIG